VGGYPGQKSETPSKIIIMIIKLKHKGQEACLKWPSKCKALSSNPSTAKKKKKVEKEGWQAEIAKNFSSHLTPLLKQLIPMEFISKFLAGIGGFYTPMSVGRLYPGLSPSSCSVCLPP
jgi:hypothetical protein